MISRFVGKHSRARHIRVFFSMSETFTFHPQQGIWSVRKLFVILQKNWSYGTSKANREHLGQDVVD